ncbi:hypothetical protein C6P42_003141 [Pichia californica]|nr:hypothetical protein C6P42_003141 [[Candida] californica]
MGEIILMQGKKNSIQQRVKFLTGLLLNPKFYKIISDALGDPSKLDMTLGTLCYFTLFVSAIVKILPQLSIKLKKLRIQLFLIINKLINIINEKTQNFFKINKVNIKYLKTEISENEINTEKNYNSKIYSVLKGFSGYLTDIRIFNRGFSIPSCIADILKSKSLLKEKDYLNFISTWCISLYQPFETIAFLFDHNWLFPDRETNNCNWWYAVSTRFWFAWVIAEFSQLSYKLLITKNGKNIKKSEFIGFIEHLATLPLCVHWSLENGCLDDLNVGLFGTIAGGLSTLDMWNGIWKTINRECI